MPRTRSRPPPSAAAGAARSDCRHTPSSSGHGAAESESFRPDVLERAEAELRHVVDARLVATAQVLRLVLGDERVVRLGCLPPVDHEIAVGLLEVAQELGADVARTLPEELRPLAVRAVGPLELLGVPRVVAEDERDHSKPPGK